jgi:LuxR family maltose regulon positive regulatory protein
VLAAAELTAARLDDGDVAAARAQLAGARELAGEAPGPGVSDVLARVGARVALAGGETAEAARDAARVADPFWGPICRARVQLAAGDPTAAATLEGATPRGVRHDVVLSLLKGRAAIAPEEAAKHVGAAVEVASANGLLQTVVSEGAEVVDLVEHVAWRVPDAWVDRLRRAASGVAPKPAAPGGDRARSLLHGVEALTERERDVLRFLPSRLTQQEIASELYVSPNTLKFHLKVIYRKLGVGSRAEAAEVARRLASGASRP